MMRRVIPLVSLLLFSWLQVYQYSDMGEDTVEALANSATTISYPHSRGTTISSPDEDADNSIPLVVGRVLGPGRTDLNTNTGASRSVALRHFVSPALVLETQATDRSPPGELLAFALDRVSSLVLDNLPSRSLAPPAV